MIHFNSEAETKCFLSADIPLAEELISCKEATQQMAHSSAFLSFMMKAKFLAYFLSSTIAISKLIFSILRK